MKRTPGKTKRILLAAFWLVMSTLWTPLTTMAHADSGLDDPGYSTVQHQHTQIDKGCLMDDCADSVQKILDCELACQVFVKQVDLELHLLKTMNTYGSPEASYIRYPSLARLERPPRHSD